MTDAEIQSGTEFDNKNALGFHIPRMWDKILDIENVIYKKIHLTKFEMKSNVLRMKTILRSSMQKSD